MSETSGPSRPSRARLTAGGIVGNTLEWYDFTVYGFFAATIGKLFFPSDQPGVSLIAAFGVYAAGFLARPFGAVIFGYVGDLVGRKRVLTITIWLMAVPTTLIGILPTYEDIGIAAPLILLLLRILQGLAASGELAGSFVYLIEGGPPRQRGFFGSLSFTGSYIGLIIGSLTAALISDLAGPTGLEDGLWRLPFLAGAIVGILGLFLRRRLPELPRPKVPASSPVVETLTRYRKQLWQSAAISGLYGCAAITTFVYVVTWLRQQPYISNAEVLTINSVSLLLFAVVTMAGAGLSDRFGRKPVLLIGSGGLLLFTYPLLWLMHQESVVAIMCGQFGMALFAGLVSGLVATTVAELFPLRIRVSACGIAYNISFALFGGTAPMVASWLVTVTGDAMVIAWYIMIVAFFGLIATLTLPESKDAPLPV